MSEDMSEIIQKMNSMLKNNEIPDSVKNMLNNLTSSNSSGMSSENNKNSLREESVSEDNYSDIPDFDMNTMLKMKSVFDSMKKNQDDPRANLLKSLKPYLKPSRKEKVDQYVKFFSMGKIIEVLNPLGGDKKNDV